MGLYKKTISVLARAQTSLEKGMGVAGAVAGSFIMLLTIADVLGRSILNKPIIGTYEFSEFLLVAMVFLGLAYVQTQRGHISVEFLTSRLPSRPRAGLDVSMLFLSLVICALITWQGGLLTWESFKVGSTSGGIIRFSLWPAQAFVPFGSGILSLRILVQIVQQARKTLGLTVESKT